MAIIINIDVMLAKRKMSVTELARSRPAMKRRSGSCQANHFS
jgi:DNA-binding Xre family transcriptional regulator